MTLCVSWTKSTMLWYIWKYPPIFSQLNWYSILVKAKFNTYILYILSQVRIWLTADLFTTVEPVLKSHRIGHSNIVSQDRWSLVTGSITLKYRTCQEYLVFKTGGVMAVVSQDRFSLSVKLIWSDHLHERPPVLKDHTFLAERPTFRYNWACHQRPPVLTDHIFVANGVVLQDRFYFMCIWHTN